MALSVFDDKAREPQAADLQGVLGRSGILWDRLVAHVEAEFPPLEQTWLHSGAKWGWSLRLKQKKRTVLYLTPGNRHFLVGLVLGEKAVAAAKAQPLPGPTLDLIAEAPRYPEGRGIRIEVRFKKDLEAVKALAAVKMAT